MDSMVLMHDLETGAESNHANESRSGRAGRPMDVWLDHDVSRISLLPRCKYNFQYKLTQSVASGRCPLSASPSLEC